MSEITVRKQDRDEQMVWAEVYAPNVPDSDKEFMDAGTIKKMAYQFMKDQNLNKIDLQHNNALQNATVVESFVARKGDPDFIEGSWVVGVHIEDEDLWGRIKKGEINGFSVEAMVNKVPEELEVEIPPVLSGTTSKAENHEHEFYVHYSEDGSFLGGMTNEVNGHRHVIRRGAATESSEGHNHRFSHLELFANV